MDDISTEQTNEGPKHDDPAPVNDAPALSALCSDEDLYELLLDMKTEGTHLFSQARQVYYATQRLERPNEVTKRLRKEWHSIPADMKQAYRGLFINLNPDCASPQGFSVESEEEEYFFKKNRLAPGPYHYDTPVLPPTVAVASFQSVDPVPEIEHKNELPQAAITSSSPSDPALASSQEPVKDAVIPADSKKKGYVLLDTTNLPMRRARGGEFQSGVQVFLSHATGLSRDEQQETWNRMSEEEREPYIEHWIKLTYGPNAYVPLADYDWSYDPTKFPKRGRQGQWIRNGLFVFREYHVSKGRTGTQCDAKWNLMSAAEREPFIHHWKTVIKPTRQIDRNRSILGIPDQVVPVPPNYDFSITDNTELPLKTGRGQFLSDAFHVFREYHTGKGCTRAEVQEMWQNMSEAKRAPYVRHYNENVVAAMASAHDKVKEAAVATIDPATLPTCGPRGGPLRSGKHVFYTSLRGIDVTDKSRQWNMMSEIERWPYEAHFNNLQKNPELHKRKGKSKAQPAPPPFEKPSVAHIFKHLRLIKPHCHAGVAEGARVWKNIGVRAKIEAHLNTLVAKARVVNGWDSPSKVFNEYGQLVPQEKHALDDEMVRNRSGRLTRQPKQNRKYSKTNSGHRVPRHSRNTNDSSSNSMQFVYNPVLMPFDMGYNNPQLQMPNPSLPNPDPEAADEAQGEDSDDPAVFWQAMQGIN